MRSLIRPDVMRHAGVAAVLTTGACLPRLLLWPGTQGRLSFAVAVLLWATFVLWGFVFGWHREYAGRRVIRGDVGARLWALTVGGGLVCAAILSWWVDPRLRPLSPEDYPDTLALWGAMALFNLGFEQLFLCMAPFAFFVRLVGNLTVALLLTVVFGVFVMAIKVNASANPPPIPMIVALLGVRIVFGALSIYLYVKGGAVVVWIWAGILQLRHLLVLGD